MKFCVGIKISEQHKQKQIQPRACDRDPAAASERYAGETACAKHNISDATYYAWKRKYGGMDVSEAGRLKFLEEENGLLKILVAYQSVQIQVLKEVNSKNRKPVIKETAHPPLEHNESFSV